MNAYEQTKKTSLKKRAALSLAVVTAIGMGGGYVLGSNNALATPSASANGMNGNHWNNAHDNGKETAYVIDAAEHYMAVSSMDANVMQVTKVMVQDNFAFGHLDGGDSGSIFFAQKTDGKWAVVYNGQMVTPEAKDSMEKSGFPKSWVESPNSVKTDE
jgi:hypothetical protein